MIEIARVGRAGAVLVTALAVGCAGPGNSPPTSSPQLSPTAGATSTPTSTATAVPTPSDIWMHTLSPSPSSAVAATVEPTESPLSSADAATLADGAWLRVISNTGASWLELGRLDGRRFRFSPDGWINVTRPANDGDAIAWWWDRGASESVVVRLDTATGTIEQLLRSPLTIFAAGLSPLGDAWYWVPSTAAYRPSGEPSRPDANGLWRQSLPGGRQEKVADWTGYATAIWPSADGSEVLIIDPEQATDTGPVHYHVWYASTSKLFDLPVTEDTSYGLFDGRVLLHRYRGYEADLVAVDPRTGASQSLPIDSHYLTAEVDIAADGAERLVYLAPGPAGSVTMFELVSGASSATALHESTWSGEGATDQGLVGGLDWARISIPGWVPFMAQGSEYIDGSSPADAAGVPSEIVSLDSGRVITLPNLMQAIEVAPTGNPATP